LDKFKIFIDADPKVRKRVAELGFGVAKVVETSIEAVREADFVIACIPVGQYGALAQEVVDERVVLGELPHLAGAVLVAKLTLGELANNDLWFGGRTKNPWDISKGSSGSSGEREARWREFRCQAVQQDDWRDPAELTGRGDRCTESTWARLDRTAACAPQIGIHRFAGMQGPMNLLKL
jgi:hypothetical protein